MGLWKEFKEFAVKGNAVDMAVGIILGAAFNSVVTSIVNDLIMPPIGKLIGGVDFKDLKWVIGEGKDMATGKVGEVAIRYGAFLNTAINFLIVACSVFAIVKFMNAMVRKPEPAPTAPPPPTKDQELLGEIRDLLRRG